MFYQYQVDILSQSVEPSQSDFFSKSVRLCELVSRTFSASQSDFCYIVGLYQFVIQLSVSLSDLVSKSVRLCQLVSQTL